MDTPEAGAKALDFKRRLAPHMKPISRRSALQLVTTLLALALAWAGMLVLHGVSYWLCLALAAPAALLLVRLFILQHDCGHGSFFRSRKANDRVGFFLGVLTLTPYHYWKRTHAIHHATSGNLDRRGIGDLNTLTVTEYRARGWFGRLAYRVYRHPLTLFVVGPVYQFVLKHRLPLDAPREWRKEWGGVILTNLFLATLVAGMILAVGAGRFLAIQLPITLLSGMAGMWLFYVQHQFEGTSWARNAAWSADHAAVVGSSHYDLPGVLHWFTGHIGLHHIHHLASRIPNYRLRAAAAENPDLHAGTRLTFWRSLRCAGLKLWDEERARLVGFRALRERDRAGETCAGKPANP